MNKIKYIFLLGLGLVSSGTVYAQTLKFTSEGGILINGDTLKQDMSHNYVYELKDTLLIRAIDGKDLRNATSHSFKIYENEKIIQAFVDKKGVLYESASFRDDLATTNNIIPKIILRSGSTYKIQWHNTWEIVVKAPEKIDSCQIRFLENEAILLNGNTFYKNKNNHFAIIDSVTIPRFNDGTALTVFINDELLLNPENGFSFGKEDKVFITDGQYLAKIYTDKSVWEEWLFLIIPLVGLLLGFVLFVCILVKTKSGNERELKTIKDKHTSFIDKLYELLQPATREKEDQALNPEKNIACLANEEGNEKKEEIILRSFQGKLEVDKKCLVDLNQRMDNIPSQFEELLKQNSEVTVGEVRGLLTDIKEESVEKLSKDLQGILDKLDLNKQLIINEYLDNSISQFDIPLPKEGEADAYMQRMATVFNNLKNIVGEVNKWFNLTDMQTELSTYFMGRLDECIDDDKKKIRIGKFDAFYQEAARRWTLAEDCEKASQEGKKQILTQLKKIMGEVTEETIELTLSSYCEVKTKQQLIDHLDELDEKDQESLDKIFHALKKALQEARLLHTVLERHAIAKIEDLEPKIKEKELDDFKQQVRNANLPYAEFTPPESQGKVDACETSAMLIDQLLAIVKRQIEAKRNSQKELQENKGKIIDILTHSEIEGMKYKGDIENVIESVRNYKEEIEGIIRNKKEAYINLDAEYNELKDKSNQEKIKQKESFGTIKKYHSTYVKLIGDVFDEIVKATDKSYTGTDRLDPLAKMIDNKILWNNICSLTHFNKQLQVILAGDKSQAAVNGDELLTVDQVNEAIKELYKSCLDYEAPTWIDILARMYAYAQVPYIANIFLTRGINVLNISAAYRLTLLMLKEFDIELVIPQLFKDHYESDKYVLHNLSDISNYFKDIFNEVNTIDDKAIIDFYTVGYSIDGEIKRKPIVACY